MIMSKFTVPFYRTPFMYSTREACDESSLCCLDPSLTVQSEKEDADINTIVRRFGLTGTVPQGYRSPVYGDFVGISDYQSALNAVMAADDAFMDLPADIRSRFHNQPSELIDFVSNESNRDEAIKLGLVTPPQVSVQPAVVQVAPPASPDVINV